MSSREDSVVLPLGVSGACARMRVLRRGGDVDSASPKDLLVNVEVDHVLEERTWIGSSWQVDGQLEKSTYR